MRYRKTFLVAISLPVTCLGSGTAIVPDDEPESNVIRGTWGGLQTGYRSSDTSVFIDGRRCVDSFSNFNRGFLIHPDKVLPGTSYKPCKEKEADKEVDYGKRVKLVSSEITSEPDGKRETLTCEIRIGKKKVYATRTQDDFENKTKAWQNQLCAVLIDGYVEIFNSFIDEHAKQGRRAKYTRRDRIENLGYSGKDNIGWSSPLVSTDYPVPSIRVNSGFFTTETCQDEFVGFDPRAFNQAAVKTVLEGVQYERCRVPQPVYDYEGKYELVMHDLSEPTSKTQRLDCEFHTVPKPAEEEEEAGEEEAEEGDEVVPPEPEEAEEPIVIRVSRSAKSKGWYHHVTDLTGSWFHDRVRVGDQSSDSAQLHECLALLDEFIKIQNFMYQAKFGNELEPEALEELMLPEINASAPPKEAEGMSVTYILLIVFGALAVLGGGYYAFQQFASKSKKESKRAKRKQEVTLEPEAGSDHTEYQNASLAANANP